MRSAYYESKIYQITSPHTNKIYVGSTINDLDDRLCKHTSHLKLHNNGKFNYITSFEILNYGDCQISLLENYVATCRKDLRLREGHYIKTLPNTVNKLVAGRTHQESVTAYTKKRDVVNNICSCGGHYKYSNKSMHMKSKKHLKHIQN